ncbi:MAG TPA: glycosyltransferase family 9 protein, partial [Pseudolabrys sp.]
MNRLDLSPGSRILVICLRRLGDVLLTTPLIRSLRRAWPDAAIDALVFADTAGILRGNPDLNAIVAMPEPPTMGQSLALAARLFRKYDLAVSTQSGDRPTFFAFIAGRIRVGPIEPGGGGLKGLVYRRGLPIERGVHRVEENLRLADVLGITRAPEVVCPRYADAGTVPADPYAVIHAGPMFHYKQWNKDGWRELAAALAARGMSVVATGGP